MAPKKSKTPSPPKASTSKAPAPSIRWIEATRPTEASTAKAKERPPTGPTFEQTKTWKWTDEDCERIIDQLREEDRVTGRAWCDEFPRRVPSFVDRGRIVEWIGRDTQRKLFGDPKEKPVITTPAEFVEMVNTINFNDCDLAEDTLLPIMRRTTRPLIPMGYDAETDVPYRLVPRSGKLWPQTHSELGPENHTIQRPEKREKLDSNYMGVNTNVQPRGPKIGRAREKNLWKEAGYIRGQPAPSRRQQKFSEISTTTTESGATGPGFVFHQIGILQEFWGCFDPDYPKKKEELHQAERVLEELQLDESGILQTKTEKLNSAAGSTKIAKARRDVEKKREKIEEIWQDTEFVVVGELDNKGGIADFWIVYDMFKENDFDGERQMEEGNRWGMLCYSEDKFSMAKMRPRAAFGNADLKIEWVELIRRPVELVKCVIGPMGPVRITVEPEEKIEKMEDALGSWRFDSGEEQTWKFDSGEEQMTSTSLRGGGAEGEASS